MSAFLVPAGVYAPIQTKCCLLIDRRDGTTAWYGSVGIDNFKYTAETLADDLRANAETYPHISIVAQRIYEVCTSYCDENSVHLASVDVTDHFDALLGDGGVKPHTMINHDFFWDLKCSDARL